MTASAPARAIVAQVTASLGGVATRRRGTRADSVAVSLLIADPFQAEPGNARGSRAAPGGFRAPERLEAHRSGVPSNGGRPAITA
ncbi:hypothetical protein FRZ44_12100 [Hypericibacter terrae]|uniref:Uncharacterized protein n=1 Tax=Hypericibacter terrae TaxID=2602015 RepID=A0A5J6MFN6_9PROT|nr:hypothetical protein FRZ44_12100 [Hypericibacter terrae]